jgi:enoyl-CoA hydratase
VGAGKAKELIFTAQQIDAEEAQRIGLVEQLVDDAVLEQIVTELAERIAAQPPLAVRHAKRAVNAALDVPIRQGLRLEAEGQAVCLRSQDFKEAVRAFLERRTPQYQGR